MAEDMEKVKVAVRVRPFNKREIDLNTKCVVLIDSNQATLRHPTGDKSPKAFTFDHCFQSADPDDPSYADQDEVFKHLGSGVLENAFSGYNACIIAYGQTGSGKSYSMMGTTENSGIIPRLCDSIFQTIGELTCETLAFKVEVSYMEIYNERVRDLLDPRKSAKSLKVREHKILGPMVDGLSILAVSSYQQIASLIEEGNKSRTVAATNMNAESSRSHAVFSIRLTQTIIDLENGYTGEKVSKISLVDLAGSERAVKSGAVGKRLEEGGNINKSLTTLGMVISALAENSRSSTKPKFVPYRDSVLTWLLKDNLGGNSRTVMIATISPSSENYEETLSTLRYADRAKRIVNHAVVNEDPNAKIIRELREEVELLRTQISQSIREHNEAEELRERLAESERLVDQMNKSWDERLRETESVYKERQRELEEIGISVAGSGIKVEKDRFYLVNLNADPSLNELLVYYVNQYATIGCADQKDPEAGQRDEKIDIVLQGLGVCHRHAFLEVVQEDGQQRMYIEPLDQKARTCVNGRLISQRTLLRNGYRLLIGNNHFFRVNCPKEAVDMSASILEESTAMLFDYDDAWREVNCDSDENANPITMAVDQYMEQIAKKHEEDKQAALEQQYEAFEKYIQGIAQGCTPLTPMTPCAGFLTPGTSTAHFPQLGLPPCPKGSLKSKFLSWAERRETLFKESLSRLKKDIIKANSLVREANMIAAELSHCRRKVTYDVTLQIPAANLRPSKIKAGTFICEPVIVVKRSGIIGHQLWSVSQLESKLVDMREMYDDKINGRSREYYSPDCELSPVRELPDGFSTSSNGPMDDYVESQENHSLIGVANVFLEVLLHDLRLDYHVPIINQQGEVSGRLQVEVFRCIDSEDDLSFDSYESLDNESQAVGTGFLGKTIKCRVRIKKATNLPLSLSHFVFCQYSFFNNTEIFVVAPRLCSDSSDDELQNENDSDFYFDHEKDFTVTVTEEFLEYVQEDALSIEVWGHRSSGFGNDFSPSPSCVIVDVEQTYKSLQERWTDVTRRLELRVIIMEMNEDGYYAPVEVQSPNNIFTGGIYQLKQGQQRRIVVSVKPSMERGNLPLAVSRVETVSVGHVCSKNQSTEKPLDSYQEEDLDRIREQWTRALAYRQSYLESQINSLTLKGAMKSEKEAEREQSLIDQWVALTEERNAVSVPAVNSDIPGAPAEWDPPVGIERHVPVVFLDLNAEDMTEEGLRDEDSIPLAGLHAQLPEEHGRDIVVPILERESDDDDSISATCSWDSSIHEHTGLNRFSGNNEVIYAVVKAVVRLSYPCVIDVVLRKRICMHLYKKASLTEKLMKKFVGSAPICATGVFYDLVAHIPKSSLDVEDRATLAMVAAGQTQSIDDESTNCGDSDRLNKLNYIEAYTKSIQAVESMLKLDRLRQEVAINGMLNKQERLNRGNHAEVRSYRMKRAVSLPDTSLAATTNGGIRAKTGASIDYSEKRRSAGLPSNSTPLVPSFVSPFAEGRKLPGIHEEENYCNGHFTEIICKSSTVPESLKYSSSDVCNSRNTRQATRRQKSAKTGNQWKNHAAFDRAGFHANPPNNELNGRFIEDIEKEQSKMNSSFASDSGCMMESGSSIATTDEDRRNLSLEDMTVVSGCCQIFRQKGSSNNGAGCDLQLTRI